VGAISYEKFTSRCNKEFFQITGNQHITTNVIARRC
jgi:hypothetical protein